MVIKLDDKKIFAGSTAHIVLAEIRVTQTPTCDLFAVANLVRS